MSSTPVPTGTPIPWATPTTMPSVASTPPFGFGDIDLMDRYATFAELGVGQWQNYNADGGLDSALTAILLIIVLLGMAFTFKHIKKI